MGGMASLKVIRGEDYPSSGSRIMGIQAASSVKKRPRGLAKRSVSA
jgi:hypothetical protein